MKTNQKNMELFLELCRPLLIEVIGIDSLKPFTEKTIEAFKRLEPEAPCFRNAMNQQNFLFGVFAAAIYRVLTSDFQVDSKPAVDLLTAGIDRAQRQLLDSSPLKRFFMARISRYRFFRNMMVKQMTAVDEPGGWRFKMVDSEAYLAFEVHHCGLVEYFGKLGIPEVCSAFCKADYTIATYMHGMTFSRTGTIADGAPCCDFQYKKR